MLHHLGTQAPVVAFALCIFGGWVISLLAADWVWGCVGIGVGLLAGDLVQALLPAVPEAPAPRGKAAPNKNLRPPHPKSAGRNPH